MKTVYETSPMVCSQRIQIETEGSVVTKVTFVGGCSGNTQGVAKLVEGMEIDEVIERLSGIRCGAKPTSCPAELAKALRQIKEAGV